MCQCLVIIPNDILQKLGRQGIKMDGLPSIESRNYFKGDFYYDGVAIDVVYYQKYTKRNGSLGTKKVKKPLIPKFCPFCGEKYVKEQSNAQTITCT